MVYRSDKPPQTKDDKNRRERERYGGIADLIMQIRAELGISVKFHAPILVNCLEAITRLQEENAKLDMDIAAAKKIQRDRKQMGIVDAAGGSFGHPPLAAGQPGLPASLPLLPQTQFANPLALQNPLAPTVGHNPAGNKALPPLPQIPGFSLPSPQQPQQQTLQPIVSSPAASPSYPERRKGEGNQGIQPPAGQQPPSLFPPSSAMSFSLPGSGPPLPPHGSAPSSSNRPLPITPDYLPQGETKHNQGSHQPDQVHPGQETKFVNLLPQLPPTMEYGSQVQQSVPGKIMHSSMTQRPRTSPYSGHPSMPVILPTKQQQYHGQQNVYQMNQEQNLFSSPGQNSGNQSAVSNNGTTMGIQQQVQQLPVENNLHQTHDLSSESRPPSSASEGFFSGYEDSNSGNQSLFSELNNSQQSDLGGHSETFDGSSYNLEGMF